uniref:Glycosyltransferase family 10 (Fucosyltransferase) C-term n=1 Tax=Candidatus Kentrum sp. FW TaxID=2126338 RepID=A0A450TYT9_9GAMM|nr:MAG: Glycosyltransferase family 10 (fucosyltransferase) C-term [Candidatus Kentron sp. FW]
MPNNGKIIVGSEGMGIWGRRLVDYLLRILYPGITIEWRNSADCHLIVKSHFISLEPKWTHRILPFVYWSGETHPIKENYNYTKCIHINTTLPHGLYCPFLVFNMHFKNRNIYRTHTNKDREYFLAYCCSNRIRERERMFDLLLERDGSRSCYSLGKCSGRWRFSKKKRSNKKRINGTWESDGLIKEYSNYRFVMAMENRIAPGYVTEKIMNAFYAGAIPIYWGDAIVKEFFNTDAFIYVNDFDSFEACADHISNLSDEEIAWMMDQPILKDGRADDRLKIDWDDDVPEYYRNMAEELGKILE